MNLFFVFVALLVFRDRSDDVCHELTYLVGIFKVSPWSLVLHHVEIKSVQNIGVG